MDEFKVPIDIQKFRATNFPWNRLMLNDPWSVGYVSQLIELKTFTNKHEWEKFYYEMGNYRQKKLNTLDDKTKQLLEDEQLIRTNKKAVCQLPKSVIALNLLNGRTETDLQKKGRILYHDVYKYIPNISLCECIQAVKYRVIGETWNGIVLREKNTVLTLQKNFPSIKFVKKGGEFDFQHAVDFELFDDTKLACAIQVKPKSYTFNTPYLAKAKNANAKKNYKYTETYHVPVFDIISSTRGEIYNRTVLKEIKKLIL